MKESLTTQQLYIYVRDTMDGILEKMNSLGSTECANFSFNMAVNIMSLALSIRGFREQYDGDDEEDEEQENFIRLIIDTAKKEKDTFEVMGTH